MNHQSEKKSTHTHNLFFQSFYFIIIIVPVHENDAIAKSLTDTHPKLEWIPEGCWRVRSLLEVDAISWRRLRHVLALEFSRK